MKRIHPSIDQALFIKFFFMKMLNRIIFIQLYLSIPIKILHRLQGKSAISPANMMKGEQFFSTYLEKGITISNDHCFVVNQSAGFFDGATRSQGFCFN